MSATVRKQNTLQLYRQLIRIGYQWPRWAKNVTSIGAKYDEKKYKNVVDDDVYHFGDFIRLKTRQSFKEHAAESDPQKIAELIAAGHRDLKTLQKIVNEDYTKMFPLRRDYKVKMRVDSFLRMALGMNQPSST